MRVKLVLDIYNLVFRCIFRSKRKRLKWVEKGALCVALWFCSLTDFIRFIKSSRMRWHRALNPFGDDGRNMKLTHTVSNVEIYTSQIVHRNCMYRFVCWLLSLGNYVLVTVECFKNWMWYLVQRNGNIYNILSHWKRLAAGISTAALAGSL